MDELELLKHMDLAMNNSFDIIVGNTTLEEMMMNSNLENLVFAPLHRHRIYIRRYKNIK